MNGEFVIIQNRTFFRAGISFTMLFISACENGQFGLKNSKTSGLPFGISAVLKTVALSGKRMLNTGNGFPSNPVLSTGLKSLLQAENPTDSNNKSNFFLIIRDC